MTNVSSNKIGNLAKSKQESLKYLRSIQYFADKLAKKTSFLGVKESFQILKENI